MVSGVLYLVLQSRGNQAVASAGNSGKISLAVTQVGWDLDRGRWKLSSVCSTEGGEAGRATDSSPKAVVVGASGGKNSRGSSCAGDEGGGRNNAGVCEGYNGWQSRESTASRGLDQVVERWSPLNTWGERLKAPEVTKSAENGRGTVRDSLAQGVGTVLLNFARRDPWGDKPSRNTATKTVELLGVDDTVRSGLRVGQVVRTRSQRGRNVVVETTGLIKGNDEKGVLPLRTSTEGLVDLLDESLTVGDLAAVVHGGSANTTARWVEVRESWQVSGLSISIKLGHGNNQVSHVVFQSPGICLSLRTSTTGSIPVVQPGVAGLSHCLEDIGIVQQIVVVGTEVGTMAVSATRGKSKTIWISRLDIYS